MCGFSHHQHMENLLRNERLFGETGQRLVLFSPIGLECLGSSCGIAPRNVYERPDVFCCGSLWVYLITVKIMSNIGPINGGSHHLSFILEVSRDFKPAGDCTNQWFFFSCSRNHGTFMMKPTTNLRIKPDVHIQKASNKSSHSKTSTTFTNMFCMLDFFHRNWVITPTSNPKPMFENFANS